MPRRTIKGQNEPASDNRERRKMNSKEVKRYPNMEFVSPRLAASNLGPVSLVVGQDIQGLKERRTTGIPWRAPTVRRLGELYLAESHLQPATHKLAIGLLRRHICPRIGSIPSDTLTAGTLKRLRDSIARSARDGFPLKATANRALSLVSQMCIFGYKREMLPRGFDPARNVCRFKTPRCGARALSPFELGQIGPQIECALKAAADTSPQRTPASAELAAALKFMLLTAVRRGDLVRIPWDKVNLRESVIRVPEISLIVYLSSPAIAILAALPRRGSLVFDFHQDSLNRAFRKVCNVAGIEGGRLFNIRRTYADFACYSNVSIEVLSRLLGRSCPWTEFPVAEEDVRAGAEKIAIRIAAALNGRAEGAGAEGK